MNTEETTTTQPESTVAEGHEPDRQEASAGSQQMSPSEASVTEPAASLEPPTPPTAPEERPAPEDAQPLAAAPSESGDDDESGPPAPAPQATAPRAPKSAEDYEEEPGDDIGNRLPGPSFAHHGPRPQAGPAHPLAAHPAAARPKAPAADRPAGAPAEEGEGGPAKKKRRRRRHKGPGEEGAAPEGAAPNAEGVPHADGETEEDGAKDESAEDHAAAEGADDGDEGTSVEGEETTEGGDRPRKRGGRGAALRDRPAFSIGEEVFGKVERVTDAAVWIDIAGKATGLFDRREIMDEEAPVEGDQFIATVASTGVRGGMLMLSRLPLNLEETRKALEAASTSGESVAGFVTGVVKGGLEVDLGGLRAFAPASHVDLRHGADLSYLVGQHLEFQVTQYAKKGRDVVVSRRKFLEEENKKIRAEAVSKIEAGSVHKGIVRKVVAWGAFIALPDAGNVEGLVHMTEASHDRGARLAEIFKPNAEIEVKVLRIDEKGKLWLSRKAVTTDPWEAAKDKYAAGTRHKGKVARLQPFGAFIELESGIDGLIHTSDLSLKAIEHPQEVVKIGDEIEVIVASCDAGAHKIALHPAPPPGEEVEARQRVAPHKILKVAVVQSVEGGLIVRVLGVTGRSARGFIPAGHTGTARGTDLRKEFPVGTQFDAKVLEIDPRRGEAKLSIRAVKEDAEKQAYQQYRAGVAREAKFGTFADLMKKVT